MDEKQLAYKNKIIKLINKMEDLGLLKKFIILFLIISQSKKAAFLFVAFFYFII